MVLETTQSCWISVFPYPIDDMTSENLLTVHEQLRSTQCNVLGPLTIRNDMVQCFIQPSSEGFSAVIAEIMHDSYLLHHYSRRKQACLMVI